jgi:hypothetical protein
MAINRYFRPAQFKYKPLGLERFAAPIAAMQQKYDTAQAALDDADYQMKYLTFDGINDPKRAKALVSKYKDRTDEISEELFRTKNYRKATSALKKVNKNWANDLEKAALEGNYAKWQKIKEEVKKQYEGRPDMEQYVLSLAKDDFIKTGGTMFSEIDGVEKYNIIQEQGLYDDLGKEWEDLKLKVANMTPEQAYTTFKDLGMDESTGKRIKEKYKKVWKEKGVIAADTERYMRSLERFKPWLDQEAKIDLYFEKKNPAQFERITDDLIQNRIAQDKAAIEEIEKVAKKKKVDPSTLPNYNDYKSEIETLTTGSPETIDRVRDVLYMQNKIGKQYDASALGELLDYAKVDRTRSYIGKAGGDGKKGGANPLTGLFDPANYQASLFDMAGDIKQNKNKILNYNKAIDDLLPGRTIGNIVLTLDQTRQKNMSKNTGALVGRQKALLSFLNKAAAQGWDERTFINALENSKTFGQDIKNKQVSLYDIKKAFRATQDRTEDGDNVFLSNYNANMQQADRLQEAVDTETEHYKFINNAVKNTDNYTNFIANLGTSGTVTLSGDEATAWRKAMINKMGVNEFRKDARSNSIYPELSINDYVKFKGYKDIQDALNKGFKFNQHKEVTKQINLKKENIAQDMTNNNVMSHIYVGDADMDEALNIHFNNDAITMSYVPVQGDWNKIEGFDAAGLPEEGTKFEEGANLKVVGNKLIIQKAYKPAGSDITKYVDLEFKPGQNELQLGLLEYIRKDANRLLNTPGTIGSALNRQTADMIEAQYFNAITQSKMVPHVADRINPKEATKSESGESYTNSTYYTTKENGKTVRKPTGYAPTVIETTYISGNKVSIVKHPITKEGDWEYRVLFNDNYLTKDGDIYEPGKNERFSTKDYNAAKAKTSRSLFDY